MADTVNDRDSSATTKIRKRAVCQNSREMNQWKLSIAQHDCLAKIWQL